MVEAPKVYKTPSLTVDAIVTRANKLATSHEILLITRGRDPFKGHYAFPGGFVDYGEDPCSAVTRELNEECNIKGSDPVLITVQGAPNRDPRRHTVTIAYHVTVDPDDSV